MYITTSKKNPSVTYMAEYRYWRKFLVDGVTNWQEVARRAQGSQRLREEYSCDPWYTKKAERDEYFWSKLYATRINS